MWYERLSNLRDEYDVELIGLIQEQHPDRCRLFMQWQDMDFPILVDSLNRIGVAAVPLLWAIDEFGIVQAVRPDFEWFRDEFLPTEYPEPGQERDEDLIVEDDGVDAYLKGRWDDAVEFWTTATAKKPDDARAWFRRGCAHRSRLDLGAAGPEDFQQSVRAWTRSLNLDRRNYIFRRRVEQYGPAMAKPYPFYDWVERARAEVGERGDTPSALASEPAGAELAARASFQAAADDQEEEPDPGDDLDLDEGLVAVQAAIAPCPALPGQSVRVAVQLTPSKGLDAHWTNDAGPTTLVVRAPEGWKTSAAVQRSAVPTDGATSAETRLLDFELWVPESAAGQSFDLELYAVYFVCEGQEDRCLFLRQNIELELEVGEKARRRGR